MNNDAAIAVSDAATDGLFMAFGHRAGVELLASRGATAAELAALARFGFSGICNVLACIKYARSAGLGSSDVLITVATDGGSMYSSERERLLSSRYGGAFNAEDACEQIRMHLDGADTQHVMALDDVGRNRIFNLGYFTWVEQQGVSLEDFEARRSQDFWRQLHATASEWDAMIADFNARSGVSA